MPRIAVEGNLPNIRKALENNGYEVVNMDSKNLASCACCVISGVDQNMMGMEDIVTQVPVISAEGMSEQEIVKEVQSKGQKN